MEHLSFPSPRKSCVSGASPGAQIANYSRWAPEDAQHLWLAGRQTGGSRISQKVLLHQRDVLFSWPDCARAGKEAPNTILCILKLRRKQWKSLQGGSYLRGAWQSHPFYTTDFFFLLLEGPGAQD